MNVTLGCVVSVEVDEDNSLHAENPVGLGVSFLKLQVV